VIRKGRSLLKSEVKVIKKGSTSLKIKGEVIKKGIPPLKNGEEGNPSSKKFNDNF